MNVKKPFLILGGFALLALVGVGLFYLPNLFYSPVQLPEGSIFEWPGGKSDATSTSPTRLNLVGVASEVSGREVPTGQKEYHNSNYRFSLLYPDFLSVREVAESGGGETITFENLKEARGFQVFVTPYASAQITDERFKKDIPSGVRKDVQNIRIDGALGASFYSYSEELGDTAEVWFVHSGFLYEITTFKELASWLDPILLSWHFL